MTSEHRKLCVFCFAFVKVESYRDPDVLMNEDKPVEADEPLGADHGPGHAEGLDVPMHGR